MIDVAFQDGCPLALIFRLTLAMHNQQCSQAQLCRLANERRPLLGPAALACDADPDARRSGMPQSQLAIHPMLNSGRLNSYVPRIGGITPSSTRGFTICSSPTAARWRPAGPRRRSLTKRTRFPPKGLTPAISSAKRSSSLTCIYSHRWLRQYSRRCHHWGVS